MARLFHRARKTPEDSEGRPTRRVFVMGSDALVRRGLKLLIELERDLVICGEAMPDYEGLSAVCRARPDVVVVDLVFRSKEDRALVQTIVHQCPETLVLVYSSSEEQSCAQAARRAGAHAYLVKDQGTDEIVASLRRLLGD